MSPPASWPQLVFHEISHTLIAAIEKQLASALGDRLRDHRVLWHIVQFYVTGQVIRDVLQARGIEYSPYLYSTGLFDRAWDHRQVVEQHWRSYVDGKVTLEAAIEGTVGALAPQGPGLERKYTLDRYDPDGAADQTLRRHTGAA